MEVSLLNSKNASKKFLFSYSSSLLVASLASDRDSSTSPMTRSLKR